MNKTRSTAVSGRGGSQWWEDNKDINNTEAESPWSKQRKQRERGAVHRLDLLGALVEGSGPKERGSPEDAGGGSCGAPGRD